MLLYEFNRWGKDFLDSHRIFISLASTCTGTSSLVHVSPSLLQVQISTPSVQSNPRASTEAPHLSPACTMEKGHIHRLLPFQTLVMKLSDQLISLPRSLTFSPTSELSLLYFGIWPAPSVSVKTISCEIENNHVERDWDGSSLSSSPQLSMDSWLLLIKSNKD